MNKDTACQIIKLYDFLASVRSGKLTLQKIKDTNVRISLQDSAVIFVDREDMINVLDNKIKSIEAQLRDWNCDINENNY